MATATLVLRRKGRVFGARHAWPARRQAGWIDRRCRHGRAVGRGRAPHPTAVIGAVHQPGAVFDAADGQVVSYACHAPLTWPHAAAAVIVPGLRINLRQESSPPCC